MPAQGEVWWAEAEERKRQPVPVVTRWHAVPLLTAIPVAPVTPTIRGISTEVRLDESAGLREPCVANFNTLHGSPGSS
jgi:mRNA interferase MazF